MMEEKGFSKNLSELMQFPKEGIFSTVIFKSDTANHTLMCLAAGTEIDEHTSTRKGVVQVLKGDGMFNIEGRDIKMKEGVYIYMPANAVHKLRSESDLAILLVLTD